MLVSSTRPVLIKMNEKKRGEKNIVFKCKPWWKTSEEDGGGGEEEEKKKKKKKDAENPPHSKEKHSRVCEGHELPARNVV